MQKMSLLHPKMKALFCSCQQNTASHGRKEIHLMLPEAVYSSCTTLYIWKCVCLFIFFFVVCFFAPRNDGILMSQTDAKGRWCPNMYDLDWSVVMETEPFQLQKSLQIALFPHTPPRHHVNTASVCHPLFLFSLSPGSSSVLKSAWWFSLPMVHLLFTRPVALNRCSQESFARGSCCCCEPKTRLHCCWKLKTPFLCSSVTALRSGNTLSSQHCQEKY